MFGPEDSCLFPVCPNGRNPEWLHSLPFTVLFTCSKMKSPKLLVLFTLTFRHTPSSHDIALTKKHQELDLSRGPKILRQLMGNGRRKSVTVRTCDREEPAGVFFCMWLCKGSSAAPSPRFPSQDAPGQQHKSSGNPEVIKL